MSMNVSDALEAAGLILDQERLSPTVRYFDRNRPPLQIMVYELNPYTFDYARDHRPREVRERPGQVSFESVNFHALTSILDSVGPNNRTDFLVNIRSRFLAAEPFQRRRGAVLDAGRYSRCDSELPLLSEVFIRTGNVELLLKVLDKVAITPALTLLMMQLEDLIAFDYTQLKLDEYENLYHTVERVSLAVTEYQARPSPRNVIEANTKVHVGKELPGQLENVRLVINKAKYRVLMDTLPKSQVPLQHLPLEPDSSALREAATVGGAISLKESKIDLPVLLRMMHPDISGYHHYFLEKKYKDAVRAAFTKLENRLNEIRDSASPPQSASGVALVHKLFQTGSLIFPYPSLAPGNPERKTAYEVALKSLLTSGIGWFRNAFDHEPHNIPDINEAEAIELLFNASYMLRILELFTARCRS